jgi:hypothetical protein
MVESAKQSKEFATDKVVETCDKLEKFIDTFCSNVGTVGARKAFLMCMRDFSDPDLDKIVEICDKRTNTADDKLVMMSPFMFGQLYADVKNLHNQTGGMLETCDTVMMWASREGELIMKDFKNMVELVKEFRKGQALQTHTNSWQLGGAAFSQCSSYSLPV